MRLSRTDLIPVLAIVAGGALGVLTSGALVLSSRADHVPVPVLEAKATTIDRVDRVIRIRIDEFGVEEPLIQKVGGDRLIVERQRQQREGVREVRAQPLIYIDGVRMPRVLGNVDPDDIERIEVIRGPAALELYGEEASAGVIQIFLKHESPELPRERR